MYLSLSLHERHPSNKRSLSSQKKNIQHFKANISSIFLWISFAHLNPDSDLVDKKESGSGFTILGHCQKAGLTWWEIPLSCFRTFAVKCV
jgi:hypothetical protein